MVDYSPGGSYARNEVLAGRRTELRTEGVELLGDVLVVGELSDAEGHFCVCQAIDPVAATLTIESHLDWHLAGRKLDEDVAGRGLSVFVERRDGLTALGRGHIGMIATGGAEGSRIQVDLPDLTPALAAELDPAPAAPMDGSSVARELARPESDALRVAEALAASWMGPLPEAKPPEESSAAPTDVKRWHALWSRLAAFDQFPFCCWPASWTEPDEDGIVYFQDEWQNGGTFGVEPSRGGVWIAKWLIDVEDSVHCAKDVAEFALQFVIFGLVDGASGRYVAAEWDGDRTNVVPGLARLSLSPWTDVFETGQLEFVGGDGLIGTRTPHSTTLCVTGPKFAELLESVAS